MKKTQLFNNYTIAVVGCLTILGTGEASAQITPDSSLGNERSVVIPNQSIKNLPSDLINGGAVRGNTLFHSFQEFNINEGRGAYFANPAGISNIFSRVTGNTPSNLLGTLGVLGNANLFFLNPNGIIFGSNVRLDIRGSLTTSTASSIQFSNGWKFDSTVPNAPPLLTIGVPIGLQYGATRPGSIVNAGNLAVGQDLTLIASAVNSTGGLSAPNGTIRIEAVSGDGQVRQLNAQTASLTAAQNLILTESQLTTAADLTLHAIDTVQIRDSVTHPFIAKAGGQLLIQGDRAVDIFALNHPDSGLLSGGDMVMRSATAILGDAHYWAGGNFRIIGLDGSLGILHSPNDPIISASGDVNFNYFYGASLHILAGGSVNIPQGVLITGADPHTERTINPNNPLPFRAAQAQVQRSDGTVITIDGSTYPTLDIRAGTTDYLPTGITFQSPPAGPSGIAPGIPSTTASATNRDITIGDVVIAKPDGVVFLTNQYKPRPNSDNLPGGNITLNTNSTGTGFWPPGVGINTNSGAGNSGSVTIDALNSININTPINTSSATGNAGNVTLLAKDKIVVNQDVASDVLGTGNAGTIQLSAPQVTVQNGANVSVNTYGSGQGGNILLNVTKSVNLDRGFIFASTNNNGNAGNVTINTPKLTVQNGANVSVNTYGSGQGGNLEVNAQELILQSTGQLSAITGGDPTVQNAPPNTGQGGNILLNVTKSVNLVDRGFIFASTNSNGNAGTLTINTPKFTAQGGAIISGSSTAGNGRGGTITFNASDSVTFIGNNEVILSPTNKLSSTTLFLGSLGTGQGGNLTINTGQLSIQDGAQIYGSTGSTGGNAADVTINATQSVRVLGTTPDGRLSSRLSSDTFGAGNAGKLSIVTPSLIVRDGGQITAGTTGSGQAGSLNVQSTLVQVSDRANQNTPSRILFDSDGSGNAGGLTINTQRLAISGGGQVSAKTGGTGQGGFITVNALNSVEITGILAADPSQDSGLFFNSTGGGNAKGIQINTGQLTVLDGGQVTVSSKGTGNAGNLTVQAGSICMDNRARLSGTTESGEGGNIVLKVDHSILLRHDSDIRTQASGTGNGGNIDLTAGIGIFAVLSEDSDIITSAPGGRGGNITAQALFIQYFNQFNGVETPESDFVATGKVNGTITLDTRNPQLAPPLPNKIAAPQLAERCQASSSGDSQATSRIQYYDIGRGGIAPAPGEAPGGDQVAVPWSTLGYASGDPSTPAIASNTTPESAILEAQGWVRTEQGRIRLVGAIPTPRPFIFGQLTPSPCLLSGGR